MAKAAKTIFVCNECGYESAKWMGKCPACNSWNTFFEQKIEKITENGIKISKERNGSILKIISRAEKLSDGIVILLIFAVSVILICISVVCAMKAMKKREF